MGNIALKRAAITAVAHYLPDEVVPNSYFASYLDTSDEWIKTRTGINTRRILRVGGSSDLALPAVKTLLEQRRITANDIDIIIFCTVTPDMFFPASACILQDKIGAKNAWGFDLSGACSGFLFGLETGRRFIESGAAKKVLVVGADKMSSILDYNDRNTCPL
ncbi:MAG: 3-oxoacyl-ACP synthase, partial [Candidatus Kapaibacterium sp.]